MWLKERTHIAGELFEQINGSAFSIYQRANGARLPRLRMQIVAVSTILIGVGSICCTVAVTRCIRLETGSRRPFAGDRVKCMRKSARIVYKYVIY